MTLTKALLRNRTLWVLVWILWMGVIFAFSHLPGNPIHYEPSIGLLLERKGAHVVEYAVLLFLTVQVFSLFFYKESLKRILSASVVWCLAYAVTDELHQYLTPFRGAHIKDVVIDGLGILLALGILYTIYSYKRKKTR